ncbi:MAG TPA: imidazole glycerol phosphate synthase subunit HisH [Bellilinea sp.]|nr:imidazole glycerol phosphate synthase subunit HisH [Bellilinea sp.]
MIALIDYGIGNLHSVAKAIQKAGGQVVVTGNAEVILSAQKVVLPGVGAFGDGMRVLQERGLVAPLHELAARGTPLLGICLGMQLMFESSAELGDHPGLGLLPGRVLHFPPSDLKVPQTGWNQLSFPQENPLTRGLEAGCYAYFNHSYYCAAANVEDVIAVTDYGIDYPSMVARGNLYGAQFHPEKSQGVGLTILRNFVEVCA